MNEGVDAARYKMYSSSPIGVSVESAGEPMPTNDGGAAEAASTRSASRSEA
jgi:hypothetical protein